MDTAPAPVADPSESTSLSDHEQSFGPTSRESPPAPTTPRVDDGLEPDGESAEAKAERDERGQFKPGKHRARSQQAGKDDIDQINAYTKRIRDAEESLGLKVERQDGERDRPYSLRRRAEFLEAKVATQEARTAPAPRAVAKKAPEPFNDPEPRYEDFADQPDQYQAHLRALAAWDRKRAAADAAIESHKTAANEGITERNRQRDEWFKSKEVEHLGRMRAYHEANPGAQAILDAAGDVRLPPALYTAIMTAPNSPELLILIASQEELRDDLTILTDGKPLNQELVALVQRRLNRGLTAGTTGSAPAPVKPIPAVPRPPNPVRTGPQAAPHDAPPRDEDGLDAHTRYYGPSKR